MLPAQDLVALARHDNKNDEPPTQESIFNVLSRRHQLGLPYTRAGTSTILVMNPNQPLNIYTEANGQLYIDHHSANIINNNKNPTSPASATSTSTPLEPHVFELASTMYYHMRRTELDQGVILR
jgi:chitin synthase